MRRALAGISLAATLMIALSFLIPLALLVREQARDRVTTAAEQRAAALAPVLALTTRPADVQQAVAGLGSDDQLAVRLPDGGLVGTPHAPPEALDRAVGKRETLALDTAEGWIYLQPVVLDRNRVAVVEAYVPAGDLTRGVGASWGVMSLLALGLVGGSVLVADRLGARVVRSTRSLKRASLALGSGNLDIRVEPDGPPELQEAGAAFNTMADRVVELLAIEREMVADLSHRLRTPLTALYLEADLLGGSPGARRITEAVTQLEGELDSIITAARTPLAAGPANGAKPARPSEVTEVVAMRLDFWSVLATQQDRLYERSFTPRPTPVRFPEDDLAAVVDALIGNVFRHTPQGTAFAVRVERTDRHVLLTVEDAGPGVADPDAALTRGVSVGGSTGLGLDIVARAARVAGGELEITRAPMGGARVRVSFGLAGEER
ncbi:HAMP domain-containing histidine kinase [Streptomyces lunaelactis]|uniref:sensor histidine kinase n=1 Tax=Streptomyces lunaelactis TaxID=1535768 RepID=UPI0015853D8A|nr:HAMP domain-containing sensor histidine kinase [Streptomyces lunaelactis]NUK03751.1 HAMP domain-containing histidine kinase [Streptomyces lunaelactis]NUK20405.1 HAMP domain-containing histidine kinase [Streptomyces lunaelactis]NUK25588.1 HAMP domain-containing histidine kinase [Streptomyces lunaelactis]NUK55167.1 HAMP domain-containing histidine kinase [Streptomyces lunaelactis]NUK68878.1 HAMP domain-containing histidine kinase [Streptomyces lunaelactis]